MTRRALTPLRNAVRWLVTPSHDPINRVLGWIAVGAVAGVWIAVLYVEVTR